MPEPAPLRPIAYAQPSIVCDKAPDGSLRLASAAALEPHDPSLAQLFRTAVERNPAGLFLAERDAGIARRKTRVNALEPWRKLSYGEARRLVDALAQALIERGLSAKRPVMIL